MTELLIIGVQFSSVGKIYHFSVPTEFKVELGDYALVNTTRGKQLGKVKMKNVDTKVNPEDIQPIERIATSKDLMLREITRQKELEALEKIQDYLKSSRFEGVKALSTEYSFDSTRLTIYLNYETEAGLDIKLFLREVSRLFQDVRLEVRQVGPRDVAKYLSGLGACGIERRCCSSFLTEFSSISIKMAKSQDISLTPAEITGMCGRLRCCLGYEHEMYEEARNLLPKRKKVIKTPLGEGKVVQVLPLSQSVVVEIPESGPRQFTLEELDSGVIKEQQIIEHPQNFEDLDDGDVEVVKLETRKQQEQSRHNQRRSFEKKNQDRNLQTDSSRNPTKDTQRNSRRRRRR